MLKHTLKIGLMGAYSTSDGYPNVKWLLESMELSPEVEIIFGQFNNVKKEKSGLLNQSRKSKFDLILILTYLAYKSIVSLFTCLYLYNKNKIDLVYAPYPAHISLFILSFVPKPLRPPTFMDCFISLYDSIVLDRQLLKANNVLAKLLLWFEKRSLHSTKKIIVDTESSALYLSNLLGISNEKIIPFPLMTDEKNYLPTSYSKKKDSTIEVFFIGTFVPLQGVEVIAEAAIKLAKNPKIHFTLIGHGQTSEKVKNILSQSKSNVTWLVDWQSPKVINELIANADICLGIFGKTAKASRVWPFKNYLSMRVGRAIISQETSCLPNYEKNKDLPYVSIPADNSDALVNMIKKLASSADIREFYAKKSALYYKENLANNKVFRKYLTLFTSEVFSKKHT